MFLHRSHATTTDKVAYRAYLLLDSTICDLYSEKAFDMHNPMPSKTLPEARLFAANLGDPLIRKRTGRTFNTMPCRTAYIVTDGTAQQNSRPCAERRSRLQVRLYLPKSLDSRGHADQPRTHWRIYPVCDMQGIVSSPNDRSLLSHREVLPVEKG